MKTNIDDLIERCA